MLKQDNIPAGPEEREKAARRAGWDTSRGPAPYDHGVWVDGLEVSDDPPAAT